MPRPHRLQTAGHLHHVITRGNNKQNIFKTDRDFMVFIKYFRSALPSCPVKIYNFVLMNNHLHFLIEPTENGSLSKLMKTALKKYSTYFNNHYKSCGHVFQGRFKSFLVQTDLYFFRCLRYIDMNPVKAGICREIGDYKWCGHPGLSRGAKTLLPLAKHELYASLGRTPQERQIAYRAVIRNLPDEDLNLINKKSGILGDKNYRDMIRQKEKFNNA